MKTRNEARPTSECASTSRLKLSKNVHKTKTTGKNTLSTDRQHRSPPFESRLKTPKQKQTLTHDDFLCSQHFDSSQTVVGWDCNSPDNFRHLQMKSRTRDEDGVPIPDLMFKLIGVESGGCETRRRGTPPLLGLWREKNIEKEQDTLIDRPKRRGRCRRKSEKDEFVPRDLLEKLTSVLKKTSGDEKPSDQDLEGDALPVLSDEEFLEAAVNADESSDLFDEKTTSPKDEVHSKAETVDKGGKSSPGSSVVWSDEEFFEDDSFIIKATQFPEDVKMDTSPALYGNKRKPPNDLFPNKTKCSRYTQPTKTHQSASNVQPSNTTDSDEVNRAVHGKSCPVSTRNLISNSELVNNVAPQKSSITTSALKGSLYQNKQVCAKQQMVSTQALATTSSCSSASSLKGANNTNKSTFPSSSYTRTSTSSQSVFNQRGSYKTSNFKKHCSFSGPDRPEADVTKASCRQRSMSGNQHTTRQSSVSMLPSSNSRSVLPSHPNKQAYSGVKSENRISEKTSNESCRTKVNSFKDSGRSTCASNVTTTNSFLSPIKEKRLSSGGFDTSLTDDILCQLAEPDEVLESQITETHKPVQHVINTSENVKSVVQDNDKGQSDKKPVNFNDNTVCALSKVAASSSTGIKSYRFKPSQKVANLSNCDNVLTRKVEHKPCTSVVSDITAEQKQVSLPETVKPTGSIGGSKSASGIGTQKQSDSEAFQVYSEDLFLSDDDMLTEGDLLAVLDEVEATQQYGAGNVNTTKAEPSNSHQSSSQPSSQPLSENSSQGQLSSQDRPSSQGLGGSQKKYSPLEIERKKQEALRRRQNKISSQSVR